MLPPVRPSSSFSSPPSRCSGFRSGSGSQIVRSIGDESKTQLCSMRNALLYIIFSVMLEFGNHKLVASGVATCSLSLFRCLFLSPVVLEVFINNPPDDIINFPSATSSDSGSVSFDRFSRSFSRSSRAHLCPPTDSFQRSTEMLLLRDRKRSFWSCRSWRNSARYAPSGSSAAVHDG